MKRDLRGLRGAGHRRPRSVRAASTPSCCAADAIVVSDTGNVAVGVPTLTTTLRGVANVVVTVSALASALHSGMFGGAAPGRARRADRDARLAARRDGDTTIDGLDSTPALDGRRLPAERFRADAQVLDGVELIGDGSVADMLWARPAVTVLGIDVPPVVGSAAAVQAQRRGAGQPAGAARARRAGRAGRADRAPRERGAVGPALRDRAGGGRRSVRRLAARRRRSRR